MSKKRDKNAFFLGPIPSHFNSSSLAIFSLLSFVYFTQPVVFHNTGNREVWFKQSSMLKIGEKLLSVKPFGENRYFQQENLNF